MGVLDCARYQYAFCVKGHMKRNTTPLSICKKNLFQQIILALREHHIDEQFYYKPIFFSFFFKRYVILIVITGKDQPNTFNHFLLHNSITVFLTVKF